MVERLKIDPITRIEGHLAIHLEIEDQTVVDARSSGEMFRGFEAILKGRDPLDAQQITQRICGVCPISHATASILAQDMAYGIIPPANGRLLRNIILAANYLQSHILHFYQLSALDFLDVQAVVQYEGADPALLGLKGWATAQLASNQIFPAAPFLPAYTGGYIEDAAVNLSVLKHYLEALEVRSLAHKLGAVFSGKMPHAATLVPGGVTQQITTDKIATCLDLLEKLQSFIDNAYLPDVVDVAAAFPDYFQVGRGCGNFLAYGAFPESEGLFFPGGVVVGGQLQGFDADRITEDVRYSYYTSPSNLEPAQGQTVPAPQKESAYSWLKAPRYDQAPMEVGPLARVMIAYLKGDNRHLNQRIDDLLRPSGGNLAEMDSVMGRHLARAVEAKQLAERCRDWLEALVPGEPTFQDFEIPSVGRGVGLTEAPRGALGHWLELQNHKILRYQCVVPTTWNCSPRDDRGEPGPVEQALRGTRIADRQNPLEATRVIRSFDPCIACAVH
jgi:ferredoxin hydrogenase large subunit/hydrogenase large subunit